MLSIVTNILYNKKKQNVKIETTNYNFVEH